MKLFDLIPQKYWKRHQETAFRDAMTWHVDQRPPVMVCLRDDPSLRLPPHALERVAEYVYRDAATAAVRFKCDPQDLSSTLFTCFHLRVPLKQVLRIVREPGCCILRLCDLATVAAYHCGMQGSGLIWTVCEGIDDGLSQDPEPLDFSDVDDLVRILTPASDDKVRQLFLLGGDPELAAAIAEQEANRGG